MLYRKVITSQTVTICNNLNIYQQMIKQEESKIRKSISEKIKKKDIRKFISVTKVRYEELIDIIFSFLKLKDNVLDYTISYKLSRYSNKESDIIACGLLSGKLTKLVDYFTTICKLLDNSQYYNIELINLGDE